MEDPKSGKTSGEGMDETQTGRLNETGYPVIVYITFVSELFVIVWPRTGESYEGEPLVGGTIFRRTWCDTLLLYGVPLSWIFSPVGPATPRSTRGTIRGSTYVDLLTGVDVVHPYTWRVGSSPLDVLTLFLIDITKFSTSNLYQRIRRYLWPMVQIRLSVVQVDFTKQRGMRERCSPLVFDPVFDPLKT